ncbi:MarR family winged helix-turn-helix transcriptional regulator [Rummeliibacillus pycnus]|uniref:MarR family winged helix-turn-helix transcriptional regulator n=1 Tax=Rummeliibacillus pycnus TaxID=101070 RepID=UPI000C99DC8C|nr:MarR family transcriptional regulator [Rummeliibacillus pycnus]
MFTFRSLFYQLILTYRPFETRLNERLAKHDLHRTEWSILYYLVTSESMTLVEMARLLSVEKPNITRTMKSLVERGYIETKTGKDKREKHMIVTAKGIEIYNQIRITVDEFEQQMLVGIPEEEQLAFIHTMQKIRENLLKK